MESLSMIVLGAVIFLGVGGLLVLSFVKLFSDSTISKPKPDQSHLQEADIYTLSGDSDKSISGQKEEIEIDKDYDDQSKKAA